MAAAANAASTVRRVDPRYPHRPVQPITNAFDQLLQRTPLLNGIHQTRHSNPRVHVRMVRGNTRAIPRAGASAGDSATVTITPRVPLLNYEAFMQLCYPNIRRIGINAGNYYNRFTYTVSFNVTMRKAAAHQTRNHTQDEVTTDFVLYPSRANGATRQLTRNSTDWIDETLFNAHVHFDEQFNEWANRNGSGFSLVSVNFVEMHIMKTRGGGSYFEVEDTASSCINPRNDDEECFKWAILCHFDADSRIVRKGGPTPSQLIVNDRYDWTGIEFPVDDLDKACEQFERNNAGMAVYVWRRELNEGKGKKWVPYCVHVSPREKDEGVKHVDLFLAAHPQTGNEHYLYIRDLYAFFGFTSIEDRMGVCRTCSIAFNTHEKHATHECDPEGEPLMPEIKYPSHDWPLGFSHHEATVPITDYVVVHADSAMADDALKIVELTYILHGTSYCNAESNGKPVQYGGDMPVRWFMRQMQALVPAPKVVNPDSPKLPVVFRDTKVIHQMMSGMDDEDLEFTEGFYTKFNAENMSNVTFRNLRFIDTSKFFPSEATSAKELYGQWQEFRAFSHTHYGLEPLWYKTAPSLAWDAALKVTHASPQYIQYDDTEEPRYDFASRAIHGPVNLMPRRLCRANNELVEGYDASKDRVYLANFDIKSAYAYSMKQMLPIGGYELMTQDELQKFMMHHDHVDITKGFQQQHHLCLQCIPDFWWIGYIFVVDMECPPDADWHDAHSDLPFAPDHRNGKLVCSFEPKLNYAVHYRLLKFYLKHGMKITKLHAGMKFKQSCWLRPFMELQEKLRNEASPAMNKVVKLMTNSVFGKSCYRPRDSHISFLFNLDKEKDRINFTDYIRPHTDGVQLLSNKVLGITQKVKKITRNQHPAVGASILELGKLQLYQWWYDRLKPAHPDMKLLYCDTDSLIVSMTEAPQGFMLRYPEWFSDQVGNLKEESGGVPGVLYVGAKPKHYLYETSQDTRVRLAGLQRSAAADVDAEVFMDVLENEAEPVAEVEQTITDSVTHRITVERIFRHYLNDKDSTRHYLNRYESVPFGHYKAVGMAV